MLLTINPDSVHQWHLMLSEMNDMIISEAGVISMLVVMIYADLETIRKVFDRRQSGTPVTRKKVGQLPAEVLAVVSASRNLKPCKRKYGRMEIFGFFKHIAEDKCEICLRFYRELDKEMAMIEYLRRNRN